MSENFDYIPENPAEELFELVGRVKAFESYVNATKHPIQRDLCAAILGFELKEDKEYAEDDCTVGNTELD